MKIRTTQLVAIAGLVSGLFGGSTGAHADAAYYYDGAALRRITVEPALHAEFPPYTATAQAAAQTTTRATTADWKFITLHAVTPGARSSTDPAYSSPVFREGDSPAGRLMALPGGVIVTFKPDWDSARIARWLTEKGYTVKQRLAITGNWYVIQSPPGIASLNLANALQESGEVVAATPNWWKETVAR